MGIVHEESEDILKQQHKSNFIYLLVQPCMTISAEYIDDANQVSFFSKPGLKTYNAELKVKKFSILLRMITKKINKAYVKTQDSM